MKMQIHTHTHTHTHTHIMFIVALLIITKSWGGGGGMKRSWSTGNNSNILQRWVDKPSVVHPENGILLLLLLSRFSRVRLCATPQMAAHQAPRPWDSPGKNTGVGCHFLLQCMKVKSQSEVAQPCPTPTQPQKGVKHWHMPQSGWNLKPQCLLREARL